MSSEVPSYLLQCDENSFALRRHLAIVSNQLFLNSYRNKDLYARLAKPVIGDFVYETSTLYQTTPEQIHAATGILRAIAYESFPNVNNQDEPEDPEDSIGEEKATYLQFGPDIADLFRWTNADFRVIPTGLDFFMNLG